LSPRNATKDTLVDAGAALGSTAAEVEVIVLGARCRDLPPSSNYNMLNSNTLPNRGATHF
jgi:hypothetical protein